MTTPEKNSTWTEIDEARYDAERDRLLDQGVTTGYGAELSAHQDGRPLNDDRFLDAAHIGARVASHAVNVELYKLSGVRPESQDQIYADGAAAVRAALVAPQTAPHSEVAVQ